MPAIAYEVRPYSMPFKAFRPVGLPKYFSAAVRTRASSSPYATSVGANPRAGLRPRIHHLRLHLKNGVYIAAQL
ncbi:MAG: hypothetical protein A3G75_00740 [Verrucomicrobia bacterium RIFCSPLOWO2_12_FULL_64_8]|nr:MAG: hypothetical protein A3G75_00740 [Verrucomicrobia bacterium RIFCSPLOWO2_12_FULL_64_8]